jgi:hypothetical protein
VTNTFQNGTNFAFQPKVTPPAVGSRDTQGLVFVSDE